MQVVQGGSTRWRPLLCLLVVLLGADFMLGRREDEEGLEQDLSGRWKIFYVSDVVQEYSWCGNLCDFM